MKKLKYKFCLLLLLSGANINGQHLEIGVGGVAFERQNLHFVKPLDLVPNLTYAGQHFSMHEKWKRQKDAVPYFNYSVFANYHFNRSWFGGLQFKRNAYTLSPNGVSMEESDQPEIESRQISFAAYIGKKSPSFFYWFYQFGFGYQKTFYEWDDHFNFSSATGADVYSDYLNSKMSGFFFTAKAGFSLQAMKISMRYDFYVNNLLDVQAPRLYNSFPGIEFSFVYPIIPIGAKKADDFNPDSDSDRKIKVKEELELERFSIEMGFDLAFSRFNSLKQYSAFYANSTPDTKIRYSFDPVYSQNEFGYLIKINASLSKSKKIYATSSLSLHFGGNDPYIGKKQVVYFDPSSPGSEETIVSNTFHFSQKHINFSGGLAYRNRLGQKLIWFTSASAAVLIPYMPDKSIEHDLFDFKSMTGIQFEAGLKRKHYSLSYFCFLSNQETERNGIYELSRFTGILFTTDLAQFYKK